MFSLPLVKPQSHFHQSSETLVWLKIRDFAAGGSVVIGETPEAGEDPLDTWEEDNFELFSTKDRVM